MEREIIRYRHNVLNIDSFASFAGIRGGVNQNCKDVYFVRALAHGDNFTYDIDQMEVALQKALSEGNLFYKRIGKLPRLRDAQEIQCYSSCYAKWTENHKKNVVTKVSATDGSLSHALGVALSRVLEIYHRNRPESNASMEKNFAVKLLYWFDQVMGRDFPRFWNEKRAVKIVAENVTKEQEYLFYYMVTLMGADALLVQREGDIEGDALKSLSQAFAPQKIRQPAPTVAAAPPQRKISQRKERTRPQTVLRRQEKSFEELAQLAASVVMIEVRDDSGEALSSGSGIMIGKGGYILTNNHVTSGGRFYSVRIEEEERIYETDEMIKYNPTLDLAVIRIGRQLNPIPVYEGGEKLVRGQKVVAIGSPLGLFNSVSDGIISGFRRIGDVDMIQFTAPISHGSSGGALLNMFGEVIGISTAGMDRGQNLNLAVGYEWIQMFVKGFAE